MTQQVNNPLNQVPSEPTLADLLDQLKKDILLSFNCHHIATIQSFNPGSDSKAPTVTATVNYKKTFFNLQANGQYAAQLVDYPLLVDMPVFILGGGAAALTMPIKPGDECMIAFNDRDLDNWFASGLPGAVATNRLHSFADGVAFIGVRSNLHPIADYDPDRAVLRNGNALVGVGGGAGQLVKIANNITTLNTLLQSLISTLQNLVSATAAITVTGVSTGGSPSGPPANASTIEAVGSDLSDLGDQIGELLE